MLLDQLDPVITPEGGLLWLPMATIEANAATLFLGLEDGAPRFVAVGQASIDAGIRQSVFKAIDMLRPGEAAIYACARSLTDWHQRHGFCARRSEEHTSELQSLMRISYAVFCLKKKKQ